MRFNFSRGKRPSEQFQISVDFTNDLGTDTIASRAVTATAADDGSDQTATILGAVSGTGGLITVVLKSGGLAQRQYIVKFTATTTGGSVYEHDVVVPESATA